MGELKSVLAFFKESPAASLPSPLAFSVSVFKISAHYYLGALESRNRRPWYPRTTLKVNIHIFGLTKCTIYCEECSCFVPVFLYAVTMLIFQIKRIISSKKWFNYVVTFFFFENAKTLGRSDDGKQRKKRGWPYVNSK